MQAEVPLLIVVIILITHRHAGPSRPTAVYPPSRRMFRRHAFETSYGTPPPLRPIRLRKGFVELWSSERKLGPEGPAEHHWLSDWASITRALAGGDDTAFGSRIVLRPGPHGPEGLGPAFAWTRAPWAGGGPLDRIPRRDWPVRPSPGTKPWGPIRPWVLWTLIQGRPIRPPPSEICTC